MRSKMIYTCIQLTITSLLLCYFAAAQEPVFPVPGGNEHQLFYLQRTPNANTVVYELNYKNGAMDINEPIHAFWIRYGDHGQNQEMSYIQRKFAYGIKTKLTASGNYEIRFNAYHSKPMYLKKNSAGKMVVVAGVNNKTIILSSIYLKINGGTFWSPNIEYAEFRGTDTSSGGIVIERIKIK